MAGDQAQSPMASTSAATPYRPTIGRIWEAVASLPDPEIPVVSIGDLGILRGIAWDPDDPHSLLVSVTPTYSGCPATEAIIASILETLAPLVDRVRVEMRLVPAWTTDWMTPEAKARLHEFGIVPPGSSRTGDGVASIDISRLGRTRHVDAIVACPRCASDETELVSQFGSTACKAQYRCLACLEPFDYFKPH